MKERYLFIIGSILFILISCFGCQKEPINGYLDGRWQIMEFEDNGVTENKKDLQLYYNFNLHVCSLSTYGAYFTDGNMRYDGKTLWLDFPYASSPVAIQKLSEYGIYSNPVTFTVESITKEKLILKEGDLLITLRKF